MLIDKNDIKNYETLNLYFHEYGIFKIPVEEISQIRCEYSDETFHLGKLPHIWDGYIKISPKGGKVFAQSDEDAIYFNEDYGGTKDDLTLIHRIKTYCNICAIELEAKRGKEKFSLPYDPLVESIYENEIELSNCPFAEIDEDGYITIGFGASSKAIKRIDNNYDELIEGWKEILPNYKPDVLKAKINFIANYEMKDARKHLFIELELLNRRAINTTLFLIFFECSNATFRICPESSATIELNMSRLQNGNIFVDFVGYRLTFECKQIKEERNAYYYFYDD